ncbi:hypothetical protein HHI36_003357 [Cryptolaemus montrouzieri]|uniref:Uncharacterized protein n=1 Tax=Cryptolaemus montrouzieri TaxID=559131 RepID=A0ABD2PDW3_9CUCU
MKVFFLVLMLFIHQLQTTHCKPLEDSAKSLDIDTNNKQPTTFEDDLDAAACTVFLVKFPKHNRQKRDEENLQLPPMGEFSGSEYRLYNRNNVVYVPFYQIKRAWVERKQI